MYGIMCSHSTLSALSLLERPSISDMVDRRAVRKPVEWR